MATTDPKVILHEKKAAEGDEKQRVLELADTPEARELRVKLAAAYQILAHAGLDDGLAGHISLRVPGAPDYFWVNPFGMFFDEITADNLVLVSKDGDILSDWPQINFAGFCIHSAIHQARADVHCAVHTHPPAGAAFSALMAPLEPIEQMGCSFYEDLAVYHDYTGIVVSPDQAADIVTALGSKRALILANHGLLTVATTVEQALIDMLDFERTCALAIRALSTGKPLQAIGGDAASMSKAILTQPERYPFQWDAMIRRLDRTGVKYDLAK